MIKLFLVIMIILFIILGFLNLKKNPYNIDFFANAKYTNKGIPVSGAVENTAYITLATPGYLWIYYNPKANKQHKLKAYRSSKYLGHVYNNRPSTYEIKNFKPGDRLIIYSWSFGNVNKPTYIAGHIYLNGVFYKTNPTNFKILSTYGWYGGFKKAGKRLGCFKDGGSRRLPYQVKGWNSQETCRYWAQRRGHPYYGLQNGGECYTGTDLNKAKSYGALNDSSCNIRGRDNTQSFWQKSPKYQILGGGWANDIYSTLENPDMRDCGDAKGQKFISTNGGHIVFEKNTRKLKPALGPDCSHSDRTYVEYAFQPYISDKISFCPNDNFDEFNPSGCKNPDSIYKCINSVRKNYKVDETLCIKKNNFNHNSYDNLKTFSLLRRTFWLLDRVPKEASANNKKKINKWKEKLTNNMKNDAQLACIMTTHKDGTDMTSCVSKNNGTELGPYQMILKKAFDMIRNNKENKTTKFKFAGENLAVSVEKTMKLAVKLRGVINSTINACSCINADNNKLKCAPC